MRSRARQLCVSASLAGSVLLASIVGASAAERLPAGDVVLRAGPTGTPSHVQQESLPALRARTATFVVTYSGFTPEATAAFQRAVDIWATQITAPVPVTVRARFRRLDAGTLGQAGSDSLWSNFPGAPRAGTWYVDALANQLRGSQLDAAPDIRADFNSAFGNWHFGGGPAPAGSYDFTTVVLHEIGHGLGFVGAGAVIGNRGTVRMAGLPIVFDRFVEGRLGRRLLDLADDSTALSRQLRGGNLFFDSVPVRAANADMRARIYAPPVFEPGSSYSHLDEATYLRGNRNALMTPVLGMGETIRTPGPITLAIFRSLGW